ncbi:hypothetical protein [Synechococcus sp. BIOS-E4-1]|uniref:hypothetical protein n=1 Tax=Synechococcus sp. BIOS-E4-1 TaxID=1400864 RepID=UPI0016448E57|nr:hypothetical protein [Synechococcus sp. BIOS-E4-1]
MVLSVSVTVLGSNDSIHRPAIYRLGNDGTPSSRPSSAGGVIYRGSGSGGQWRTSSRGGWGGFQGRGPSGVK